MADCDIFREQLAIKYPLYGHALWEPSPRDPDKPVQVGDVGFIRKGKFHRLFNALLPADDPSHECGVPENYEPLVPSWTRHLDGGSLGRNHYCSAGVCVEPDPGYHSRPGDIPQVTFKYNRTRGAAVLSLPVTARREDTLARGDFQLWIVKHIDSCFAFARKHGLGIERMEEIILVTGCDRTKSWANIAFLENQDASQVSFGVRVENPVPSITFQFLPESAQGAVLHHGPEGENLPENQCVFVRGYRVARTFWILPRRLKAAAGPSSDPDDYDCDPDTEFISIPAVTNYRDPLYLLLDYIAEQAYDCDMVLTHDDDLVKIHGLGHDSSLETLGPDVIMDLLRRSNMEIQKVPCVSATDNSPILDSDTSVVKVAMLLMNSRNWDIGPQCQGSSLAQNIDPSCTSELHAPDSFPVPTIRGYMSALKTSLPADHDGVPSTPHDLSRFEHATEYSITSSQMSAPGCESAVGIPSSSSRAATESPPQTTRRAELPLSPTPAHDHLSYSLQRTYTLPQQGAQRVEALEVSSLNVLSDGVDTPPPPMERASNHPASLAPGFSSSRTTTFPSASTPFSTKFSIEGVSARLSPAIITRQPQHPILSLPPISQTLSPAIDSRRLRSSLRSVPALPMQGSGDQEPAEHDNAVLDDLDEDAEEETPEAELPDTASEDGESTSGPHSSGASELRPGDLPAIVVAPSDMSSLDSNKSGTVRKDNKIPRGGQEYYFNSRSPETQSTNSRQLPSTRPSAWATPTHPALAPTFGILTPAWATSAPTAPIVNPRSGMYHQASRSMIDMAEILRQHQTTEMIARTSKGPVRDPVPEADTAVLDTEEPDSQLGPSLRRRLSMPTFGPSTAPPAYPEFRFGERRMKIQPRDEEGCERLPHYTNDIYLRAIMPRKMEFSAPGVQARDRKWRRVLCILEGTAFRVYRCPPTATGKGLIGNLWEKTVGVGNISAPATQEITTSAKVKGKERESKRRTKFDAFGNIWTQSPQSPVSPTSQSASEPSSDSDAQSSPSATRSRLIYQRFRRKNRDMSGASDAPSASRTESQATHSFSALHQKSPDASSSQRASSLTSASPPTSRTPTPRSPRIKKQRHLWVEDPDVPLPQEEHLLHSYALHNAESGLGTDYSKRQNVIRIRMEGQQFLLQAPDVAGVVDWIEGFQAAANIAQDLDERLMPKGPLFPRRRRRRARVQATSSYS